jgi:tRNA-2-methylthio-N6-dimethylallyladenosine synthase
MIANYVDFEYNHCGEKCMETKKYYINTYGCQMNVHESEKIAGIMEQRGYQEALDMNSAEIIIYNTCCVRETAENKVYGSLGRAAKIKLSKPNTKIIVCGCMSQKPGAKEELKKRFPYIDVLIGTHNINLLGEYLDRLCEEKRIFEVWDKEREINDAPLKRSDGINSFVNIMYGCNNFCSYCIVPYVKGRERSRKEEDIICEVKGLIDQGKKNIMLLGQNVNSYGKDFDSSNNYNHSFARLLEKLQNLDGSFRIKFMTSHPKDLSEDVVKVIAEGDKLQKYIHLPVQSGSDRILQLMNRKYTSNEYLQKIEIIRKHIPFGGISSDIIVGFPSETEQDFLDTVSLVEQIRLNNVFTFIYNKRSGTPADTMDNQVPHETKIERIERLIALSAKIEKEIAASFINQTQEVLCESVTNGVGYGKTTNEISVYFPARNEQIGKFIQVLIKEKKNSKLYGDIKSSY